MRPQSQLEKTPWRSYEEMCALHPELGVCVETTTKKTRKGFPQGLIKFFAEDARHPQFTYKYILPPWSGGMRILVQPTGNLDDLYN